MNVSPISIYDFTKKWRIVMNEIKRNEKKEESY